MAQQVYYETERKTKGSILKSLLGNDFKNPSNIIEITTYTNKHYNKNILHGIPVNINPDASKLSVT